MALQQTGELKKRAWLAKQRLKMGYLKSSQESDVRVVLSPETAQSGDETLYRKVCDILDRDELTLNPIGQLIDDDVYSGLDPTAKQRYVLELSDKFRELKERYYRERTGA